MFDHAIYSLTGVLPFLAYFGVGVILVALFICIYTWVTPHDELALIRANNSAAAVAFGGALIGFALPLASAISHSLSIIDCVIWGAIGLLVQILTFLALRLVVKDLPDRIVRGEIATGILLATTAIAVGLINSSCMSY